MKKRQHGVTFIFCLLLLVLMSLLTLATANSNVITTLVHSNAQLADQQRRALQNTLALAVRRVKTNDFNTDDYIDMTAEGNTLFEPSRNSAWPSAYALDGVTDNSNYLIEYLGCFTNNPSAPQLCASPAPSDARYLYRLTARVTTTTNQVLYAQRTLVLPFAPGDDNVASEN